MNIIYYYLLAMYSLSTAPDPPIEIDVVLDNIGISKDLTYTKFNITGKNFIIIVDDISNRTYPIDPTDPELINVGLDTPLGDDTHFIQIKLTKNTEPTDQTSHKINLLKADTVKFDQSCDVIQTELSSSSINPVEMRFRQLKDEYILFFNSKSGCHQYEVKLPLTAENNFTELFVEITGEDTTDKIILYTCPDTTTKLPTK